MINPTQAERMRAACVESCERHAKARARDARDSDHAGEINTARNHKRLYEYMGVTLAALPLPEPTPLEAARERFTEAALYAAEHKDEGSMVVMLNRYAAIRTLEGGGDDA